MYTQSVFYTNIKAICLRSFILTGLTGNYADSPIHLMRKGDYELEID